MIILRDGDPGGGGGGGGGNDFVSALPETLRSEPSLQSFKDVGGLAKSYVEAQKLIGANRVAIPGEKASQAEWEAFYNKIGRPESVDKYERFELKDEKGNVLFKGDDKEHTELMKFFHSVGLTNRQAKAIQEYSAKYFHGKQSESSAAAAAASNAEIQKLREAWGDKFDVNVDTARAVIKKFGGDEAEEITKFLDSSGLGNNVPLIKLLNSIGSSILEDRGNRGGGDLDLNDKSRAMNEIATLKGDKNFQEALNSAQHPGHQEAVNRWMNLFKIAYPGKVE